MCKKLFIAKQTYNNTLRIYQESNVVIYRWFAAQMPVSTKLVFEKIANIICPIMWTYDICAFDTGIYWHLHWHDNLQWRKQNKHSVKLLPLNIQCYLWSEYLSHTNTTIIQQLQKIYNSTQINFQNIYSTSIIYLLHWSISLEENMSTQQLCENASNWPHVHCHCVVTSSHQNLWSSIVLSHNLTCHRHIIVRFDHSSQSKVTYLKTCHTDTSLTNNVSQPVCQQDPHHSICIPEACSMHSISFIIIATTHFPSCWG